jgi:hypothetical protein
VELRRAASLAFGQSDNRCVVDKFSQQILDDHVREPVFQKLRHLCETRCKEGQDMNNTEEAAGVVPATGRLRLVHENQAAGVL